MIKSLAQQIVHKPTIIGQLTRNPTTFVGPLVDSGSQYRGFRAKGWWQSIKPASATRRRRA